MPEPSVTAEIVKKVPSFVIPEDKIVTIGGGSSEAAPLPVATPESAPETLPEAKVVPEKETAPEKSEDAEKKASSRRFERRIDRAIRARAEAEAKANLLAKENEDLRAKQAQAAPVEAPGAPRKEDFTDIDEYAKAVAKFELTRADQERSEKARREIHQRELSQLSAGWESQVVKASDKYEDWDEIVGDLKPGLTPWGDAIMLSENGADVAYYLGKNEREAERIMALSPRSQFVEIGRLSAKLALQPETPKKPSQAPAPITPVTPVAGASDDYRQGMSPQEYLRVRKKLLGNA